jgi:hypothetical protein
MKTTKFSLFALSCIMASVLAFASGANAFTGNDKDQKKTATHSVSVDDIAKQNDMPRELRNGSTLQVINNLSISGFNITPSQEGKYALAFSLGKSGTAYVRIVDNGGYDVYFETFKDGLSFNKQIDLSLLPAGTYFFQVTQGGKTFTKKLIFS